MMPDDILIVFSDHTDLWWLKGLKRGFRHCCVLIRFADIWICVEPLAHRTLITRLDLGSTHELIDWFNQQGDKVIKTTSLHPPAIPLKPALFSCVEQVKRMVGIQNNLIFTPWQLYKFLTEKD